MGARFFEDFEVGQVFQTQGRTVTETDVLTYAYLSGDLNPLHTDAEFARRSRFGQRLAHGPLVTVLAAGLRARLGLLDGTAVAALETTARYLKPVFFDDTITVRVSVVETRPTGKAEHGIVVFGIEVLNQHGETVQTGSAVQLVRRHTEAANDGG